MEFAPLRDRLTPMRHQLQPIKNEEAWQIINNNMQFELKEAKMEAVQKAECKDQKEIGASLN